MYIYSTNLPDYNSFVSSSWIASEKYYNCDNFYNHILMSQKKRKWFKKNR